MVAAREGRAWPLPKPLGQMRHHTPVRAARVRRREKLFHLFTTRVRRVGRFPFSRTERPFSRTKNGAAVKYSPSGLNRRARCAYNNGARRRFRTYLRAGSLPKPTAFAGSSRILTPDETCTACAGR